MLIGVSGYHELLIGKVDFFEVDSADPLPEASRHYEIKLSANQYYYRTGSAVPLQDRVQLLKELCERMKATTVALKLTPQFFNLYTVKDTLSPFQTEWKRHSAIPLLIDLPAALPRRLGPALNFIFDPLWHRSKNSPHWKIHGWSEERWVRRYCASDLTALAKSCVRHRPQTLLFAHSQRVEQVLEFQQISKRLKKKC